MQIRDDDEDVSNAITPLNDMATFVAIACERAFQLALDGTCRSPIAGHATYADGRLTFRGEVLAPDGSDCAAAEFVCNLGGDKIAEAETAGRNAGLEIKPRALAWLAL